MNSESEWVARRGATGKPALARATLDEAPNQSPAASSNAAGVVFKAAARRTSVMSVIIRCGRRHLGGFAPL